MSVTQIFLPIFLSTQLEHIEAKHNQKLSSQFTELELLQFLIKDEKVHPKHLYSVQINTDNISPLEILPMMIIRATTAKKPFDQNFDEKRSNHSMITRKLLLENQKVMLVSNLKTQTTYVVSDPNINKTESTEIIHPSEVFLLRSH